MCSNTIPVNNSSSIFDILPDEIIRLIISPSHLEPLDLAITRRVCKAAQVRIRKCNRLQKDLLCNTAAARGYTNVVEWARSIGGDWSHKTTDAAAANGHLELLKKLHANGCPIRRYAATLATSAGHKEVMIWLKQIGIQQHYRASTEAARNGHVELLTHIIDNGFPYNVYSIMRMAAANGHVSIINMMHARGYNMTWDEYSDIQDIARQAGHLNIIKWYAEHDLITTGLILLTIFGGPPHILAYLEELRCNSLLH